ncbi:Protein of unknown function [Bacillus cytotoxicus]|nr:Protein of unknown function [Bacillus cytotoxicus]
MIMLVLIQKNIDYLMKEITEMTDLTKQHCMDT